MDESLEEVWPAVRRKTGASFTTPDLVVVGGGLVGLAVAAAAAERQLTVLVLRFPLPGAASAAAAGMLAPSVEHAPGSAHAFAIASRDRYPQYLAWIRERTGTQVPLNRRGILQLAFTDADAETLRRLSGQNSRWLDAAELADVEPGLAPAVGALLHLEDGAVDNVLLLHALQSLVAAHPRISVVEERVAGLRLEGVRPAAVTASGVRHEGARIVLAAGAWSATLSGLPAPLPVRPVRGQMLALSASPLRHVVYGPDAYLVPRTDGRVLAGSTMEEVGFEVATTPEALALLRAAAERACPQLARVQVESSWAGLRPVTPDLLPIIGRDPVRPALIHACGHSRNGVLLAPLTGECVAALAADEQPEHDLAPFSPTRFPQPEGPYSLMPHQPRNHSNG